MTETVITVQGTARAEYAPERSILSFTIAADGPDRADAVDRVTAALDRVSSAIAARHDATSGPVTAWSADRVSVTAQRPWTNDGSVAPIVHRAAVSGRATVTGLDALPELVEAIAAEELATIDGLEWSLTEGRRTSVLTEVRSRAVKDAVTKATIYAQSIGLGSVHAVALADPGMLGDPGAGNGPQPRMERVAMMASDARGGAFSLRPEPIVVEVAVDARFVAR